MNKSKLSLAVLLALSLTLVLAAASWARPWGCGMRAMSNLTPEQAGKLFDLKEKFRNETVDLRKQMMVKHLELRDLWKADKPDEKAIIAKQKEVNAVRDQIQQKRTTFMLEARKIDPQARFGHGGMGCGMGAGMGAGMGGVGGMMCPMGGPGSGPGPGPGPGGGVCAVGSANCPMGAAPAPAGPAK